MLPLVGAERVVPNDRVQPPQTGELSHDEINLRLMNGRASDHKDPTVTQNLHAQESNPLHTPCVVFLWGEAVVGSSSIVHTVVERRVAKDQVGVYVLRRGLVETIPNDQSVGR